MKLYWNPHTRCAIATEKALAVFLVVPVDMDPLFYAECVMDIAYDCHTPIAYCQLVKPTPPYPSRLPPPPDPPYIPPIRIAPDQTIGVAHPASDTEERGGDAAPPAPANTPSPPDPRGGLRSPAIISPDPAPADSHFTPNEPPSVSTTPLVIPVIKVEMEPRRGPSFGISKPYGGRY